MRKLLQGLARFQRHTFKENQELFGRLSQGQSPSTLFITCSDSRIVPSLITHTDPGDLFVLRNAGNLVPKYDEGLGEAATIEYAVSVLKVADIVVCGHSQCGVMQGLLNPTSCAGFSAISRWLERAQPTLAAVLEQHSMLPQEQLVTLLTQANVAAQFENLRTHPSVRDAVENGTLHLHGWVYSIATGEVSAYSAEQNDFQPAVNDSLVV